MQQQEEKEQGKPELKETLNFSRLQEEHAKAIRLSKQRIDKWAQFKADYEALQARMYSLPDKLTHDVMVPFGKFAYMPGQLYDTNEIMVLLGDNWFVKRSVKQALEIAERRKQNVSKMLEDEHKQMSEWEARHTFTDSFRSAAEGDGDTVDIKEEYDEEAERKRKERRQRNVKSGLVPPPRPAFPKPTNTQPSSHIKPKPPHPPRHTEGVEAQSRSASGGPMAKKGNKEKSGDGREREGDKDRELWARLDELEREEEEYLANERERELAAAEKAIAADVDEPTSGSRFSDDSEEEKHVTANVRERSHKSEDLAAASAGPLRITIKHTPSQDALAPKMDDTEVVDDESREGALFKSPADIFRHFCKAEVSGESNSEGDSEASKKKIPTSPSTVEKGVKWSPNLVEFSDGSKSPTAAAKEAERKGRGRGRGRGGGKRDNARQPKEPAKPPMPFSGQVIERFSPIQPAVSTEHGPVKKISKFKASRQQ